MTLNLSESLRTLVERQFHIAKASSALSFTSSELHILRTKHDVPFQLRFCPTLAKKPINNKDDKPKKEEEQQQKKRKIDPFDNPSGDLVISSIPHGQPTHVLVLNKFPIIRNHFILATKDFKEQTDDLDPEDLAVTLACLKSWQQSSGPAASNTSSGHPQLFAFFNSGSHSGASQPHRHIQFLPVEDMAGDHDDAADKWQLLMSSQANLDALPIATFQEDIPQEGNVSKAELHAMYQRLLAACRGRSAEASVPDGEFSYNMGMTTTSMVLCARRSEGVTLRKDDGTDIGYVALNGTLLGGTLMVKKQEEWDYLRARPDEIDHILRDICLPSRDEGEAARERSSI